MEKERQRLFRKGANELIRQGFKNLREFTDSINENYEALSATLAGSRNLSNNKELAIAGGLGKLPDDIVKLGEELENRESYPNGDYSDAAAEACKMFAKLSKERKTEALAVIARLYAEQLAEGL